MFGTSNLTEAGYQPEVQWGVGALTQSASCLSYNYTHEPAFQKNTITHVCNVTGLTPNTFYNYRVGSASDGYSV